ncbi:pyridoxamine 5'-phosphate oxidase family protein [Bacillus sp. B190/17]|uniref:Pyridoxamine 5'-phosphate oxidase family protein n=1 Tax=Bacillus lumedeiriae TaxID=3058829 RepID=A0ABW8I5U9_9BACI
MANRVETYLVPALFDALQEDRLVTIATIDKESGGPAIHAISWIRAFDEKTLRIAVDGRSRMVNNLKHNPAAAIHLLANESAYAISGTGTILTEKAAGVPVQTAIIEIHVSEIRDVMFYGSKIIIEPKHEKTYDEQAAKKLDDQVLEALKRGADS